MGLNSMLKCFKISTGFAMQNKYRNIIGLCLLLLMIGCSHSTDDPSLLIRLVDSLDREDVLRSPFLVSSEEEALKTSVYPVKSAPLLDAGIGRNPFGLKRKIRLGGAERNAVFAPPESEYVLSGRIHLDSVLEFGIGLIRDENSEKLLTEGKVPSRGVTFLVSLEIEGRKKTVYQKYLNPIPASPEPEITFIRTNLDLPYTAQKARITFTTRGAAGNFSFWVNPVLYRKDPAPRNIILISIDTLRADHLGCYGYEPETSPNIDALAQDSALFLNTYALSPWTLPSHVSLLTALFGIHHQVARDDEVMDPALFTLAEILRMQGYSCGAFTGGGFVSAIYGFSQGFDSYDEAPGRVFAQDSAERVFVAASDWIDRHKDREFFLFLHTYQIHNPYTSPYPYKFMFLDEEATLGTIDVLGHVGGSEGIFKPLPDSEKRNIIGLYDGEIRYVDEKLIGPLVEKLQQIGLYDQTMIIFTSDHGEEFYEHGGWEHGHSLYDEQLKVPLIIKFPQSQYAGTRPEQVVSLVDILPTATDILDIPDFDQEIDGASLIPILSGRDKKDRVYMAELAGNILNSHIPKKVASNRGQEKLILNHRFAPEDLEYFTFPPQQVPAVELYDLASDPSENTNIADKRHDLATQIIRWIEEISAAAKKLNTGKAVLDEKLREQLKALGYIR